MLRFLECMPKLQHSMILSIDLTLVHSLKLIECLTEACSLLFHLSYFAWPKVKVTETGMNQLGSIRNTKMPCLKVTECVVSEKIAAFRLWRKSRFQNLSLVSVTPKHLSLHSTYSHFSWAKNCIQISKYSRFFLIFNIHRPTNKSSKQKNQPAINDPCKQPQ